ncbi:MAG TPA: hypothetical protein VNZ52_08940 [Candidatus Thermoplasmatota archaeon]|nr:hypothetical protein [Candidatus Thermoplasmatota archaeon]
MRGRWAFLLFLAILVSGCVSTPAAEEERPSEGGPSCLSPGICPAITTAPTADTSWRNVPLDLVAVGRITLNSTENPFRFTSAVTTIHPQDYEVDETNRTLRLAKGIDIPEERARALEIITAGDEDSRRLYLLPARANLRAGPTPSDLSWFGEAPYEVLLSPELLRFETRIEKGCVMEILEGHQEWSPKGPFEGMTDFGAGPGAPQTVAFHGEPGSLCPEVALRLEALGAFNRSK